MKKPHLLMLTLALGLGIGLSLILLLTPEIGRAGPEPVPALSLEGSMVTTDDCYQADPTQDTSQTLCFQVHNGSTDGEWIEAITMTLPDAPPPSSLGPWRADACGYQDPTDSVGNQVNFACAPSGNQVVYTDNDSDGWGEISSGASWGFCVDVTVPADYTGPRYIPWELGGDDGGGESGSIEIERCTPLRLTPSEVEIEGCNGLTQTLEFKLENYGAGNVSLDFTYDAPEADFTGSDPSSIQDGGVLTFAVQLAPRLCLEPGEMITARLSVEAPGGDSDTSIITQTITENAGWQRRDDSPVPTMDNAVIWAHREDGTPGDEGLWSVGGYGSGGVAQRYDPATGGWLTYTNPLSPVIEYPMDGCYGVNGDGHEVIVLFPDTIVTGELQIFDITTHSWYTESVPAPDYPAIGRWGQDIVSMIQHTGENVCYLSGGSTQEGGGRTRDLWEFHPDGQPYAATYVGKFYESTGPYTRVFGFHASWYVPWIGDQGGICVAGGADHNHRIISSTECYDIGAGSFNLPNVDLGTLPEPWWGMADGWQITDEGYELWIANGVAQDGTLLPASAYIREGMSNFEYGPEIPQGLYRLEGDAWENKFYTLNGSRSGFWYSEFSLQLTPCPTCHRIYLPLVLRNYQ